ncbi:hypothetical protein MRB53_001161 [Persea americana]|uniref:Uncharacterized protein n=1 Tax=Persea americana TaxID=3435 RepID=A0ACC2MRL3_PERAE|nr:hypothetical protein MRB53_001161 [Persea americana]
MEHNREKQVPHVLIFPFPAQGHINSMLRLAKLFSLAGFHITFLNSDHNHHRLLRNADLAAWAAGRPFFRFRSISDGLPPDHRRSAAELVTLFDSLKENTKPILREMLVSDRKLGSEHPVTCIIGDGIMSFVIDVAEEVGLPVISFRTSSACSFWSYFCIPRLVEAGELPFGDDADMDRAIIGVPGMESILRRRDLPSFLRAKEVTDPGLQIVWAETLQTTRSSALILNTFEDLEPKILSHIRVHCPTTYSIGPLHALHRARVNDSADSTDSSSLWKEDKTCTKWLDAQPNGSVLYVSFGSFTVVSRAELVEFWHGLVNSQARFLWAMRPDLVDGGGDMGQVPEELVGATKERGFLVEWAPQEEVLAHPAVGGFLTHSGWNSTLESVFAGVPMICWPFFADQQINSRFVSEVWRVGLDMKDTCDRETVEKMVRELMLERREEFMKSAEKMAALAKKSIREGGSTHMNLEKLIQDIRTMCS